MHHRQMRPHLYHHRRPRIDEDHDLSLDESSVEVDPVQRRQSIDESGSDDGRGTNKRGGSSSNSDQDNAQDAGQHATIAQKESTDVGRWKFFVLVMLLVSAGLVVGSTFFFLKQQETDEFETAYEQHANAILEASKGYYQNLVESMTDLRDTATSDALVANTTWPNVILHHFEIKAAHARLASHAEVIIFSPLVYNKDRSDWETHTRVHAQTWLDEGTALHETTKKWFPSSSVAVSANATGYTDPAAASFMASAAPVIYEFDFVTGAYSVAPADRDMFVPIWGISPPPTVAAVVNCDLYPSLQPQFTSLLASRTTMGLLPFFPVRGLYQGIMSEEEHVAIHQSFSSQLLQGGARNVSERPHSVAVVPVYASFDDDAPIVGFFSAILLWDSYLSGLLPVGVSGITAVVRNSCGQAATYEIDGDRALFLGGNDTHNEAFDTFARTVDFSDTDDVVTGEAFCSYTVTVYPSNDFLATYESSRPAIFAALMAAVFLATGIVFLVYVRFVQRRQDKVLATATRTNAIVASLFPSNVRDRIFKDAEIQAEREDGANKTLPGFGTWNNTKHQLGAFLDTDEGGNDKNDLNPFSTKPIADLFPETTVMFADLVGFTAWSSVREPTQVFALLETVYHAFDEIAKSRRIFKVETVGDCYVAVAGLPEPRPDHAVAIARFAAECNNKLNHLVKVLESSLGPDTGDLAMRFGLHSGPCTAGVLRGARARFQLFGDTVNTAARMETNGTRGRIHASQETADLLIGAGKAHWVTTRDAKITAKGKGELQTYWIDVVCSRATSSSCVSDTMQSTTTPDVQIQSQLDIFDLTPRPLEARTMRLIDWNVEVLLRLLRQIVARRQASSDNVGSCNLMTQLPKTQGTILDEVKEIIALPKFDHKCLSREVNADTIELPIDLESEVRDYVTTIAMLYRSNPFHNFEHASHVTMSVSKLLSRIVAPTDLEIETSATCEATLKNKLASTLHDHTYGITSSPLVPFACVLSALVHDVDHTGVPNAQLICENAIIAKLYQNKSIAEQNSVDLAWELLMDDRFGVFRRTLCATQAEFTLLRALVVNSVMATDIMDKDLKALRNARWDKAFSADAHHRGNGDRDDGAVVNRKATIVIEHLIQASDVAHTMQHWHVYRKWNERLFREMYVAYKSGRADKDPSTFWYQGEIGFFDFYIIPLAKKLKDCGVFGVSSHEYLNYAQQNRAEWERRGHEVVEQMQANLSMEGTESGEHIERACI